jgi:hypothetical protein
MGRKNPYVHHVKKKMRIDRKQTRLSGLQHVISLVFGSLRKRYSIGAITPLETLMVRSTAPAASTTV